MLEVAEICPLYSHRIIFLPGIKSVLNRFEFEARFYLFCGLFNCKNEEFATSVTIAYDKSIFFDLHNSYFKFQYFFGKFFIILMLPFMFIFVYYLFDNSIGCAIGFR